MYAHANGVRIYFDVEGAGLVARGSEMVEKPPCFVVHGGPAYDHSYFKPWLTPLSEDLQLIYLDHRGTGRSSEAPEESYTLKQIAADIEELRRHLGFERISVLGHSVGGFIALTYALAYPASVATLITVATASSNRWRDPVEELIARTGNARQKEILHRILAGEEAGESEYREWFHTMAPLLHFRTYDPGAVDEFLDRMRGNRRTEAAMWRNALAEYDLTTRLSEVTAPTLVIAGEYDGITSIEVVQQVAAQIPNATFQVIPECGHWIFVEAQDAFVRLIAEFVKQHT